MSSKECIAFCSFLLQDTFCSPQVALGDAATEQITDITTKACGEVGTVRGWKTSSIEHRAAKCMIRIR